MNSKDEYVANMMKHLKQEINTDIQLAMVEAHGGFAGLKFTKFQGVTPHTFKKMAIEPELDKKDIMRMLDKIENTSYSVTERTIVAKKLNNALEANPKSFKSIVKEHKFLGLVDKYLYTGDQEAKKKIDHLKKTEPGFCKSAMKLYDQLAKGKTMTTPSIGVKQELKEMKIPKQDAPKKPRLR